MKSHCSKQRRMCSASEHSLNSKDLGHAIHKKKPNHWSRNSTSRQQTCTMKTRATQIVTFQLNRLSTIRITNPTQIAMLQQKKTCKFKKWNKPTPINNTDGTNTHHIEQKHLDWTHIDNNLNPWTCCCILTVFATLQRQGHPPDSDCGGAIPVKHNGENEKNAINFAWACRTSRNVATSARVSHATHKTHNQKTLLRAMWKRVRCHMFWWPRQHFALTEINILSRHRILACRINECRPKQHFVPPHQ